MYREYLESIEREEKASRGEGNITELFADFIKARATTNSNNKELRFQERVEKYVDIANQISGANLDNAQIELDMAFQKDPQNEDAIKNAIPETQATYVINPEANKSYEDNQLIVQTMLKLWNKVFEHSVSPIKAYSNKKNQQTLLNLYRTIFNSDLNSWREYVLKVNGSQFLMGEKKTKNNFKAVFSWLIKPETTEKILNGEYGVGDRELDINNKSKTAEIKKEEKVNELEKRVANNLKENLNELQELEKFRSYIENEGYEEDMGKYKLGLVLRHIPKRNFLYGDEYKLMRDRLFESYLMKKHTYQSRLEIRDKLRTAVNNSSDKAIFNITKEAHKQCNYLEENIKHQELYVKKVGDNQINQINMKTTITKIS